MENINTAANDLRNAIAAFKAAVKAHNAELKAHGKALGLTRDEVADFLASAPESLDDVVYDLRSVMGEARGAHAGLEEKAAFNAEEEAE